MIERNFDNYFQEINKAAGKDHGKSFKIENEFTPALINGECEIVLRFLPQPKSEASPFIENRTHSFKGEDGKWHVVDCLRKAGHKCPLCEYNAAVFKAFPTNTEEGKAKAKKIALKRAQRKFVSNIQVVKNPGAPDTEGQRFRFKYGTQIMEMILDKISDKEDPDKGHVPGTMVFDYYKGANFILKLKDGQYGPNPKDSYFGDPKPISTKTNVPLTEEQIQEIDDNLFELKPCEKDTSNETWEDILSTYEKFSGRKLFKTGKDGKPVAIIPGMNQDEEFSDDPLDEDGPSAEAAEQATSRVSESTSSKDTDAFLDELET